MLADDPDGDVDYPRAPDRQPRVVLFDVFDTMLQMDALRTRFADVGRPEHEWELFFTRTVRDGMALALVGGSHSFHEVARAALRTTTRHALSEEALDHVLDGFFELPPQPDVEPALALLARARVPVYALTHGAAGVACDSLDRVGLRTYLRGVLSTEQSPGAGSYRWACREVDVPPERAALVGAHWWDLHGAVRAGLVGGFATRLEGAVSPVGARPHVVAERLDDVVEQLLDLPA